MNLQELRAQHPDVFEAARQEGVTQERDRVGAHLTMGESSGDLQTAHAAIREGAEMTQTLMAQYMAAGMNRSDVAARQKETDAAAKVVEGADATTGAETTGDLGDQVVALLKQQGGL